MLGYAKMFERIFLYLSYSGVVNVGKRDISYFVKYKNERQSGLYTEDQAQKPKPKNPEA